MGFRRTTSPFFSVVAVCAALLIFAFEPGRKTIKTAWSGLTDMMKQTVAPQTPGAETGKTVSDVKKTAVKTPGCKDAKGRKIKCPSGSVVIIHNNQIPSPEIFPPGQNGVIIYNPQCPYARQAVNNLVNQ